GRPGGEPLPPEQLAEVPSLVNLPVDEARRVAMDAGFQLRVDGAYPVVTGQVPPAGARLSVGSTLIAEAKEEGTALTGEVRVPDLAGKTLREAASILAGMNLRLAPEGTGLASSQDPAPGTLVSPGSSIRVTFQTPATSP
ncbi:MAG: PASTA domain-containing protein, partial [Bacillota bacterium]